MHGFPIPKVRVRVRVQVGVHTVSQTPAWGEDPSEGVCDQGVVP